MGKAIDYALKHWEALTRFVNDGVLEIDSNLIENSIRPSAPGKKEFFVHSAFRSWRTQRGDLHLAGQLPAAWARANNNAS
ncbi:MAG TPA: transposase [Verrucomicrobiae bacterium]|nr:transposase [Verrucomicrobiae bacterium]